MALYIAVVAASWIATRVPLRVAYALATAAGSVAFVVARSQRHASVANLAVVLNQPTSSRQVRETSRHAFQNNAKNWIDSLRLGVTRAAEIERRVEVDGWDVLQAALDEGNGVIMVGAHLGNIDVVGQIMAARGLDVTIPVEPVKPEALFERTQRLRQSMGIRAIPAANSARRLLRALKDGGLVGIMADRNLEAEGIEVRFFGRPAVVARGPAWLATHSLSPVLCGTGIRLPDGTFRSRVSAIEIQRTGDRDADVGANAERIIDAIEDRIRQHPEQWCMFARIWDR